MVSIAGRARRKHVKRGVALLEKHGFEVSWEPANASTKHPYLAASDQVRLTSLNNAFADERVRIADLLERPENRPPVHAAERRPE